MDTSVMFNAPVLAGAVAFLVLVLLIGLLRLKVAQRKAAEQAQQRHRHLDRELQKTNKQLLEVRSVVVGRD